MSLKMIKAEGGIFGQISNSTAALNMIAPAPCRC
jgi:hypothetical protein